MELKFFQHNIPPYAILSHVWEAEEVTFQDYADLEKAKKMCGYAKIAGACDTAKKDDLEYIWIDTCCINKDSSAELSEAINSMYMWYTNAIICYAYLSDVPSEGDHRDPHSLFTMSRWFTRGWTLQELIAPRRLVFYSRDWVDIGTKATLQDTISSVTRIRPGVIVGESTLDEIPIAVRMSWAAGRRTTRVEDTAYSLMGIFDVNMPLLYGEGWNAFIRLQHEIIKKSTDHSIFAWRMSSHAYGFEKAQRKNDPPFRRILAHSPEEFRSSGNVERIRDSDEQPTNVRNFGKSSPYTITNWGLHIELPVHVDEKHETFAFLNCCFSGESEPIALALSPSQSTRSTMSYFRSDPTKLAKTSTSTSLPQMSSIYIIEDYPSRKKLNLGSSFEFEFRLPPGNSPQRDIEFFNCQLHMSVVPDVENGFSVFPRTSPWHYTDAALLFTDPHHEVEQFAVIGGQHPRLPGELWCKIISANEPEDESDWKELMKARSNQYRLGKHIAWTKKNLFLDRAFKDLTRNHTPKDLSVLQESERSTDVGEAAGWSVTASCQRYRTTSPLYHKQRIVIELKRSISQRQKHPSPRMEVPGKIMWLIIPPKGGFTADVTGLHENDYVDWVEHGGFFVLYTGYDVAGMLPFRNADSKEEFSFLVKVKRNGMFFSDTFSAIEETITASSGVRETWNGKGEEHAYSAVLSQGKVVFVTVRSYGARPVVHFIITLTVKDKA